MNKIILIARREFLSRVQKKTFLLSTILFPLLVFVFYAMIIYFSIKTEDNLNIAIADEANIFNGLLVSKNDVSFEVVKGQTPSSLEKMVDEKKYSGYIYIPKEYQLMSNSPLELKSNKTIGLLTRNKIEKSFAGLLEEQKLLELNINKKDLAEIENSKNNIEFKTFNGGGDNEIKMEVSYAVGYISGFLIYVVLLIYGTMVMRGVMEEKMNRIAEVIVSSVRPFQLMMGKITGIGAVGLLQFVIWIILIAGLQLLLPFIFPDMLQHTHNIPLQSGAMQVVGNMNRINNIQLITQSLNEINFALIIPCFIIYFIGGYLLYSSFFAAIGSAVNEDPQDAQSLVLPVIMPIIFALVFLQKTVNEPASNIAVFASIFPLTSPIIMMARITQPNVVPVWQLLTSIVLLVGSFIVTTWIAAKVYRTGILLYGKKITWKEMWKWTIRKG